MVRLDTIAVGNITKEFILPKMEINYRCLHFDPAVEPMKWFVKDYALLRNGEKGESLPNPRNIRALLTDNFRSGELDPQLGMGYVIVSSGTINLSMWREDYPHLPHQTLWTPREDGTFFRTDLTTENSYCIFEQEIAADESKAWKTFLESRRLESDKQKYINNIATMWARDIID